jgi:hypothetical protein
MLVIHRRHETGEKKEKEKENAFTGPEFGPEVEQERRMFQQHQQQR